ncbi:TetR/AcrR family transcriptional regulator [Paraburkholderia sp. CNPSo 3272]|uniref:TetR/AcrR family transcriptional regulator n=1 Tax=Paraburkholderia sp. CNPSo 3272 TaxID=2940931 RepID=UPI0020B75814|nr:TetR/AcrR family transcriptional regulator [Paraburkholderia sp. CNPSo 3272]MCP3727113.1 TetR/AcrR family transcriptional regulator [Paraburkholderia sp. CNPSo 3272]
MPEDNPIQKDVPLRSLANASVRESTKRPMNARGRQTAAHILACATAIFVAEGYGGLSMRKVAASAGVALSNLQHYFSGREALFAAIMEQTTTEYFDTYESIRNNTSLTPLQRLEKVIRLLIETDKQPQTQSLFINMWALAQTHEFARRIMEEAYVLQRSMLKGFIEAVNSNLSPLELSCRAALVTCQIEGLVVLIPQRNRFPSDVRGIEDEAVRALLNLALAEGQREAAHRANARE